MILCGDKTDVSGEGVIVEGGRPPRKDIRRQEEREGRFKNKYITIINESWILERSLSEVRTPPPYKLDIPNGPVASKTHTQCGWYLLIDSLSIWILAWQYFSQTE